MKRRSGSVLRWFMPGFGEMLGIAAFLGALLMGPRMLNMDGDLGRHITIGSYILRARQIPTSDLFSHTMMGQPLTPHEWLSQVIFALAHQWMGLDGVVLVTGLVIGATFWIVFRMARPASRSLLLAVFVTALAMAASSLHWLTRPHIFTFLFLALWLYVLEGMHRGNTQRWWLLPVLMLPWANLHGAFIAGFVTWAIFGIGLAWDVLWGEPQDRLPATFWRRYLLGGAAALAVTLLNPSGMGLWKTSTGYIGNRYLVGHTFEYLPPNFHESAAWPFLIMIGLLAVLLGLQSRRVSSAWLFLSAAWLVMGLYSARNVPLFAIAAAPLLASLLGNLVEDMGARSKILGAVYQFDQRLLQMDTAQRGFVWPALLFVLAALVLNLGVHLDAAQSGNRFDPQVFPVQAVNWLEQHPQTGKVFNHFPWGGYLLYRQWPEQQVFIDGQTDFYGEDLTRQYEQVLTLAPGWQAVLDRYSVDWIIVPSSETMAGGLREDALWHAVYQDETAVIFERTP